MPRSAIPSPPADLPLLSKAALHELADGLLLQEQWFIDRCVDFVISETRGLWHGRARAMMCRRLKHCPLARSQQARLVACITGRLMSGEFSEQFKDQLRLSMHLDPPQTFAAARQSSASARRHVARYARWVLAHEAANAPSSFVVGVLNA